MYMGTDNILKTLLYIKATCFNELPNAKRKKLCNDIHEELIGLRNRHRESERNRDFYEWHQRGDSYDSIYGKAIIDYEMNATEIEEFIEEEWCRWYNPYDDGRDCTGVWFTSRIRCIPCNGKTFIYHFKSCDV